MLYSHDHYTYIYTCRNIFNTIRTNEDTSLEKYTSHFIGRFVCESELETEQNSNIFTPTLMAITAFLSRSPELLNRGPGGSASARTWFSFQHLLSNSNSYCSIGGPEGPLCWVLVLSTTSYLQLTWTPTDLNFLSPGLYNNLSSTLLPASVTISHSIQPLKSQGRPSSPDIFDRMPLLFTLVPFFFWQLGRVGGQYATYIYIYIYNTVQKYSLTFNYCKFLLIANLKVDVSHNIFTIETLVFLK